MSKESSFYDLCKNIRVYKYRAGDHQGIADLKKTFTDCYTKLQEDGLETGNSSCLVGLREICIELKTIRSELDKVPEGSPLETNVLCQYLQNLIPSMLNKASEKSDQENVNQSSLAFAEICSILPQFNWNCFFNDEYLAAIKSSLEDISNYEYSENNFRYNALCALFQKVYTPYSFKSTYPNVYQKIYPEHTPLIVQCILKYFLKDFSRLYDENQGRPRNEEVGSRRTLVLKLFPEWLLPHTASSVSDIARPSLSCEQLDCFCQTLFNWSRSIFGHVCAVQRSDGRNLSKAFVRYMKMMNICTASEYFRRCACDNLHIVDSLLTLYHKSVSIQDKNDFNQRFGNVVVDRVVKDKYHDFLTASIALLYHLSIEAVVIDHLRTCKVSVPEVFYFLYKHGPTNTTKFHAQTVIGLMNNDIDKLQEPNKLGSSYVYYLSKTISRQFQTFEQIKLTGVVIHLKVFIQNEEVKSQVILEDGVSILTTCASDPQFNIISVQLPSLEILWSTVFNLTAAYLLRDNKAFIDYITALSKSKDNVLMPVAKGVKWQLDRLHKKDKEKKQAAIPVKVNIYGVPVDKYGEQIADKKSESKTEIIFTHDLMISYCHKDKTLCHNIYKHLQSQLQCQIWIDIEEMHGSVAECMAEAIDRSRVMLICYSHAYKESAACRSEATYAHDLKRTIIPVRMDNKYRANGWLKMILGDRLYVDFGKYEFDKAYGDLIQQLRLCDRKFKDLINNESKRPSEIRTTTDNDKPKAAKDTDKKPETSETSKRRPISAATTVSARTSHCIETSAPRSEQEPLEKLTKDNIDDFFHKNSIEIMLPVLGDEYNGNDKPKTTKDTDKKPEASETSKRRPISAATTFSARASHCIETSAPGYEQEPLEKWTKDNIDDFFHKNSIEIMLPLLGDEYNGRYLLAYCMTLATSSNAFELLRDELKELHQKTLPYNKFVTFKTKLEPYIPAGSKSK